MEAVAAALAGQLATWGCAGVAAQGGACARVALLAVAAVADALRRQQGLWVVARAWRGDASEATVRQGWAAGRGSCCLGW